jgi:hypothetical protein
MRTRGVAYDCTHAGIRPPTSTMNPATTLVTSHACWLQATAGMGARGVQPLVHRRITMLCSKEHTEHGTTAAVAASWDQSWHTPPGSFLQFAWSCEEFMVSGAPPSLSPSPAIPCTPTPPLSFHIPAIPCTPTPPSRAM